MLEALFWLAVLALIIAILAATSGVSFRKR